MAEIKTSEVRLYLVHGKGIVVTDENNFFIRDNGFINNDDDTFGLAGSPNKFMLVDFDNTREEDLGGRIKTVGTYTDRIFQPGNTVQVKYKPEHGTLADFSAKVERVKVISREEYAALTKKQEERVYKFNEEHKAITSKYDSLVDAAIKAGKDKITKIRQEEDTQKQAIPRVPTLDTLLRQEAEEGK